MNGTGAGTAIMIGIAAALWFLYLLPSWVRRREYLATERTAMRLQQTMRVMAETSEIPGPVRVAATAREAARRERMLRAEQRRADALAAQQVAAVRRATPRVPRVPQRMQVPQLPQVPSPSATVAVPVVAGSAGSDRRRRMRRTRAMASVLMLGATVVSLVQIWLMTTTGVAAGSWLVLGAAFAAGSLAIATQRRLDSLSVPRVVPVVERAVSTIDDIPLAPAEPVLWTPVPVPKPLYLSRSVPEYAPASDPARLLREAAADAERALRLAEAEPEVVPFRAPVRRDAAPSRFAGMGIVDPSSVQTPDLDEALRRRRAAV